MFRHAVLGAALGAALTAGLVACGGGDDKPAAGNGAPAATTAATSAAGAAPAATSAAAAAPQTLAIKGGDFFYEPNSLTAKPGKITISMANDGPRPHTIVVKNKSGSGDLAKSGEVPRSQTGKLEFEVTEPGTYEIYCSLPGHADRGQKATLTVSS